MKFCTTVLFGGLTMAMTSFAADTAERRLSMSEYRDRMQAAWIGQMAGVVVGAPTEFKFNDQIVPAKRVPAWTPELINGAFTQDDLYVEMTFLKTLEDYGLDVSIRQAGIDFANTKYELWCANAEGRNNLRLGIAPPDCAHPSLHRRANDIDYQIESDFSGIVSPGCPNGPIRLSHTFGRLVNYGDGVWAGAFIGGLYAEAFFTSDRVAIVEAGLAGIPPECDYAKIVRSMLADYRANPNDWTLAWSNVTARCRRDPAFQRESNGCIDVRINGAMTVLGLLWGQGDLDRTIEIALRGGYDSDCNPSSAAGVVFTTVGASKLPARFVSALDKTQKFSYTTYDLPGLFAASEKIMRQIVAAEGGRIEKDASGEEWLVLPPSAPKADAYRPSWNPEPPVGSRFTAEEMKRIIERPAVPTEEVHGEYVNAGIDLVGKPQDVAVSAEGLTRIALNKPYLSSQSPRVRLRLAAEAPCRATLYVNGTFAGSSDVMTPQAQSVVFDLSAWKKSRVSLELVFTAIDAKPTTAHLLASDLMGN